MSEFDEFDEFDQLMAKGQDVLREFSMNQIPEVVSDDGLQDIRVIDVSIGKEGFPFTVNPKPEEPAVRQKEQPAIDSPRVTYNPYKPR